VSGSETHRSRPRQPLGGFRYRSPTLPEEVPLRWCVFEEYSRHTLLRLGTAKPAESARETPGMGRNRPGFRSKGGRNRPKWAENRRPESALHDKPGETEGFGLDRQSFLFLLDSPFLPSLGVAWWMRRRIPASGGSLGDGSWPGPSGHESGSTLGQAGSRPSVLEIPGLDPAYVTSILWSLSLMNTSQFETIGRLCIREPQLARDRLA
jgi:hypothetical protein